MTKARCIVDLTYAGQHEVIMANMPLLTQGYPRNSLFAVVMVYSNCLSAIFLFKKGKLIALSH